jgi:hypothetical protein
MEKVKMSIMGSKWGIEETIATIVGLILLCLSLITTVIYVKMRGGKCARQRVEKSDRESDQYGETPLTEVDGETGEPDDSNRRTVIFVPPKPIQIINNPTVSPRRMTPQP